MLEELLRKEGLQEKKKNLSEKYGIIMTEETERRVGNMCNWSDVIVERGELRAIKNLMETMELTAVQAMDALKIEPAKRDGYLEQLMQ